MRSAVSARPLRAEWVLMKYSSTDRPSRNEERIGRGICWPLELATTPFMPASDRTWIQLPAAPAATRV